MALFYLFLFSSFHEFLPARLPLPPLKHVAQWLVIQTETTSLPYEERFLKPKRAVTVSHEYFDLDRVEARSTFFSEMQSYWNMPLNEMTIISALAVTKGKIFCSMHVQENPNKNSLTLQILSSNFTIEWIGL